MKGFDARFADLPDYILGITREIWEDRGLHTLHRYYADDIVVRTPEAVVAGNRGVIAATMATLHEFPDRQLLGEDVIWCGTPEAGMLSSHRILSTATHAGDGAYGRATGARLRYRIIADCHARENRIDDEWLIRDQGAIVRQLGRHAAEHARARIAQAGGPAHLPPPLTPATDRPGPYRGTGNDSPWGARYADLLTRLMGAEFSAVPAEYDRACHLEHPGGVTAHGWAAADAFWLGLRAALPDAAFAIHHVIGNEGGEMPPRAALRWSLSGVHAGHGAFGPPTGAEVHVMGISHAEFGPRGLRREYVLIDETAVWTQILLSTGAADDTPPHGAGREEETP